MTLIDSAIRFQGQYSEAQLPILCLELHCPPSKIREERYYDIAGILSVMKAKNKQAEAQQRKLNKR